MNLEEIKSKVKKDPETINNYDLSTSDILNILEDNPDIYYYIATDSLNKEIIKRVYELTGKVPYGIKKFLQDSSFVTDMIESYPSFYKNIYNYLNKEEKEKYFKLIENSGLFVNDDSPDIYKSSPIVALYNIKKDVQRLNLFSPEALTDSVVSYAIENNYKYEKFVTSYAILGNPKMVRYLIESDVNILSLAHGNAITSETVNYALDNGFVIDYKSPLMRSSIFLSCAVLKDPNVLNHAKKEAITEDVIKNAYKSGYCFSFEGKRKTTKNIGSYETFSDDISYDVDNNLFLLDYPLLVLSSYLNGYPEIIYEEKIGPKNNPYYEWIIENAIVKKIPIKHFRNNNLFSSEKMCNYINNTLFKTSKSVEMLEKFKEIFPLEQLLYPIENLSCLLTDDFVSAFGENRVYMMIKYLLLPNVEFEISSLLNKIKASDLKNIFSKYIAHKKNSLEILEFQKFVNFFNNNISLLNDLICNYNLISLELIENLYFIINENSNLIVNSIDELKNIHKIRYKTYNDDTKLSIKDKIFMFLCQADSNEVINFLETKLNSRSLIRLKDKVNVNVEEYINFFKKLEYVSSMDDELELLEMWNNLQINENKKFSLSYLENLSMNLYSEIYKRNLTDLSKFECTRVSNGVEIYEFKGEDFSFVSHVVNSFDYSYVSKYGVDSFYTSEFGRSYLCTSYVDQNHIKNSANKDSIILIFNDFSDEQLFSMSNTDLHSMGEENNSLSIGVSSEKNLLPFDMSALTKDYNEMVFIRQNNNSKRMLPTSIMCYDTIGENIYKLASDLNIPIVLIDTKSYENKNNDLYALYKKEVLNGNLKNLDELIALSHKTNQRLTEEEFDIILSYLSKEKINNIIEVMRLYNYSTDGVFDLINKNNRISNL